jgi:hypothetical protein
LTSLLNKNDFKLSYNTLFILINISILNDGEKLFCLDEDICCNIASFLGNNRNHEDSLFYGVLLIRNICMDKNVCDIFNKYKITEFLGDIYEKHLLNNKFMEFLMTIISFIISYEINDKTNKEINFPVILPCIKIMATQIRLSYPANLFYKYIFKLYQLVSFRNSDLYYEIIKYNIHKELMNIYPSITEKIEIIKLKLKEILSISKEQQINKEEYDKYQEELDFYESSLLIILKILGKLMSLEDGIITQTLLSAGISSFLTKALQSHDIRIIKNVCFCISNICAGTCGQISYLFNDNTLYELIKVSKNILEAMEMRQEKDDYYSQLKDAFREINYVFALTIVNTLKEKMIPFVECENYTPIVILMKGLKYLELKNNIELIEYIFSAIKKIMAFKDDFEKKILFVMEKYELKENLEKIIIKEDLNIAQKAGEIHDSIFGII